MIVWLDYYAENTPAWQVLDNATTILGRKSEPQPDGLLRILPECGGRTRNEGGIVRRRSRSSSSKSPRQRRFVDLGPKLADYQKAGVPGIRRPRDRPGRDLLVRPGTGRAGAATDRQ